MQSYLNEVSTRYNPHFRIFAAATDGTDDFEDWQAILSVKGKAGMEAKATAQLAALVLNIMSLKVGQYEVVTADGQTAGDVMSDLNGRRAQIIGMTPLGDGNTEIEAAVPLASMQRYATDLRSITQAQAVFSATMDEYAIMPRMEAEKVIARYAPKEEVEA